MPDQNIDKLKAQLARTRKVAEQGTIALTGELVYLGETAEGALRAASTCKLEQMARALLYAGMAEFTIAGHADRAIEAPSVRAAFHDERLHLSILIEELVAEALEKNCGCRRTGKGPAPKIGATKEEWDLFYGNPSQNPSSGERLTHDLTHHMTGGICDMPGCYMGHRLSK